MDRLASRIREMLLALRIDEVRELHQSVDVEDIQRYQLAKIDSLWWSIQRHVPYYSELRDRGILPSRISSWDDFKRLPILTRQAIQEETASRIDRSRPISWFAVTGGSTGEPIRVPRWRSEKRETEVNMWVGRGFYGIRPSDRLFHLWGHSHLFGGGYKKYIKLLERRLKNMLLGYERFSAYELTVPRLTAAGDLILRQRPNYIVGYSRSLAMLARQNAYRREEFLKCPPKAVIATTEAFLRDEDAKAVSDVFGCPVAMEYGAVETGVIAYTHPSDGQYRVFWNHYLLEGVPGPAGRVKLLLTALYPRAMPLIRYEIGDCIEGPFGAGESVFSFRKVMGRDHDLLKIGEDSYVHSEALTHCSVAQRKIRGIQIVQDNYGSITFNLVCVERLSTVEEERFRQDLKSVHPILEIAKIRYVEALAQTPAGKTKWIIRHE